MGQTEPGLVAFYDIRPGNEASLFLQPRSPHPRVGSGVVRPHPHPKGRDPASPKIFWDPLLMPILFDLR